MEQSVTNTLIAEKAALEKAEQEKQTHKRAAREFFNLLEELYPPGDDSEYWEKAAGRVCEVYQNAGKPRLLMYLMVALMEYLEDVAKESKDNEKERVPDTQR